MSYEKFTILETQKTDDSLPHQFTCEFCGFTSLQGFEKCPHCVESDNFESKEEIGGEGKWLVILGSFYLVISFVVLLNSGGNIVFFEKASDTDFMSVSNFAAMFAFPLILIPTGIITFIRKKDNWKGRLIIGGIIAIAVFSIDQFMMRIF